MGRGDRLEWKREKARAICQVIAGKVGKFYANLTGAIVSSQKPD
jgi:hypothetical protein